METSANTQAILLLTTHFVKTRRGMEKPLTPREWGQFAEWLKSRSLTPENLLKADLNLLLQSWQHRAISVDRIKVLLDRGVALSLSMEKWLRAGLWVMTRSDSDYPARLKQRLGGDSPAVLFGCGRRSLLNGGGIAVVGSRSACSSDIDYSRKLGTLISESGRSVVSGGARGVDETAVLGALENEGTAVGVTADNLLRTCTSAKYRCHLVNNNLTLISPFNPEAGFNAGNAMQRNKYIYCLADLALVVHSGRKGGTWNGAIENLKRNWVSLLVKETSDTDAGNSDLIRRGAIDIPSDINNISIEHLLECFHNTRTVDKDLFSRSATAVVEQKANSSRNYEMNNKTNEKEKSVVSEDTTPSKLLGENTIIGDVQVAHTPPINVPQKIFYQFFLNQIQYKCSNDPQTLDDLVKYFDIKKSQLSDWLKRAISEGQIKRLTKPVRYEWIDQKKIF